MSDGGRRVLAVSSGGGHWVQLRRIAPAFRGHEVVYVTVSESYAEAVEDARVLVVNDATRWDPGALFVLGLRLFWIVLRERPHVVFSTGAAPGLLALSMGRLLGARTIWLDSMANVERLSLSGRLARRVAGLWLTQWEHLSGPDGPEFAGRVY